MRRVTYAEVYKRCYDAVNYRLRRLAGGRWASHCRPTSIVLLLTERCNARCVHCDIWKNKGKETSPSVEQWQAVLADLRRWLGPVQVTLSGGEALLKPFTTDLVSYGSSIGLLIELLTHGYWPDQSRIEALAQARPWRVTVSLDGVGPIHDAIRRRRDFFTHTSTTLCTLQRARRRMKRPFSVRLKTVIMAQNLAEVPEVAYFAQREELEVFYQPIEQNYNTPEDQKWFEQSANWPTDADAAVGAVRLLIRLKREGLPIVNSYSQLEAMVPYFQNPDSSRVSTQTHSAHEGRPWCQALTSLQVQASGDVTICTGLDSVDNIQVTPIRRIWESRPAVWAEGCCLYQRFSPAEKNARGLTPRP